MIASKENCRRAINNLDHVIADVQNTRRSGAAGLEYVREFLQAAERKLPSEAAFKRDRKRLT